MSITTQNDFIGGGTKMMKKVVYCKDCVDRNTDGCPLLYYNRDNLDEHSTDDEDYCSYGRVEIGEGEMAFDPV